MHHHTIAALVTAFLTSACAQAGPAELSEADAEAVREASRQYTQLARDTAWARWGTMFTDDAVFLPPNSPAVEGAAAIEAWGRTFPPIKDLRIEPTEVVGRGDLAFARGRYSMVIMVPNQPEQPDSGKYIEIWRRQSDGSWKLFRDIFNSDVPLPAPPPPAPATRRG